MIALLAALLVLQPQTPPASIRIDPALHGYWTGTIVLGGESHEVTLHFAPQARVPVTLARRHLDGMFPLPGRVAAQTASTFTARFERPFPFVIDAMLLPDGRRLDVRLREDTAVRLAVLSRAQAPAGIRRPQTPGPPFPYDIYDARIDTGSGILAATVTMPRGRGPFPGIVLLSGTGPQDRDNSFAYHRPFAVIADYLSRRGFAVLRFDDRGAGSSSGLFGELRTPDADALDAVAALRYLRAYAQVDRTRTGFIGHSEGGVVAPLAATMTPEAAFIVLLGPLAVDAALGAVAQHEAIGRARGRSETSLAFEKRVRTRIYEILQAEKDDARARAAIDAVIAEATRAAQGDDLTWLSELKRALSTLARPRYATTFRQRMSMSPSRAIRLVRVPVLALFAERDVQVVAGPNAAEMRDALGAASPLSDIRTLPGLNHVFQTATTGAVEEYARIEETIAPAALEAMASWLARVTKR